jgi:hypothetical protein
MHFLSVGAYLSGRATPQEQHRKLPKVETMTFRLIAPRWRLSEMDVRRQSAASAIAKRMGVFEGPRRDPNSKGKKCRPVIYAWVDEAPIRSGRLMDNMAERISFRSFIKKQPRRSGAVWPNRVTRYDREPPVSA